MKKLLFYIGLVIYGLDLSAQQPYYDAVQLGALMDSGKFTKTPDALGEVATILRPYLLPPQSAMDLKANQVLEAFKNPNSPNFNPFIASYIDLSGVQTTPFTENIMARATSFISAAGGLDVTNLADGLAKFIVERAKQELSTAFFEKFRQQMGDPRYEDLRILFPETYNLLMTIDKDVYNFNRYMASLREAFQHDLSNLFLNFQEVINSDKYKPYFAANPELKSIFSSAMYIIDGLSRKKHPGDILKDFPLKPLRQSGDSIFAGSVMTMQMISASLRSRQGTENYWVTPDEIQLHFDDDLVTFRIYMGLLYQQASGIWFGPDLSLRKMMAKAAANMDSLAEYKVFIDDLVSRCFMVKGYLDELKGKKVNEIQFIDYYRYFNGTLDIVGMGVRFCRLPYINIPVSPGFQKYMFVARRSGDIYLNVNQTNYASAIANTLAVLDTLFSGSFKAMIHDLKTANENVAGLRKKIKVGEPLPAEEADQVRAGFSNALVKKYTRQPLAHIDSIVRTSGNKVTAANEKQVLAACDGMIHSTEQGIKTYNDINVTRQLIVKYGTFMAGVATAKSSDEVQAVIEATALPPGSSITKTYSVFNVAINSYLGVFYGHEYIKDVTNSRPFNSWGISAPVGVSFSFGFPKCKKYFGALTVFGSAIDLGAVAAFRLSSPGDSAAKIPTVTLESIVAPGAFVFLSRLFNTPMSFGAGYQYCPSLRKVTVDNNEVVSPATRLILILTVDIPLFNVYTKPRNLN
jgi:hypothetical protein